MSNPNHSKSRTGFSIRIPILDGTEIILRTPENKTQEYIVDALISDLGSSCLCYRAHLKGLKQRSFILKEFYPKGKGVIRKTDGELVIPEGLEGEYTRFTNAAQIMKKLSLENEYRHNIVGDVAILYGNGTVYCRNEDYSGGSTWNEIKDQDFLQVLTCLKAIARLLSFMHGEAYRYVYMDLKPENILLRDSGSRIIYDEPVLIDFDSVLTEGPHTLEEIHTTKKYRFPGIPAVSTTGTKHVQVNITGKIDQYAFGVMFKEKTEPFKQLLNVETRDTCDALYERLVSLNGKDFPFENAISELDKIIKLYNKPRIDMCKNSYEISKSKFDLLYRIFLPIAIIVCVGLSVIYAFLVRKSGTPFADPFHGNVGMMLFALVILLFFVMLLEGLVLLLIYFSSQQHNAEVAALELEHGTCGSDITLFILGDMNHSKFREGEQSKLHHRRQKRRRVLWIALGILLGSALGISVYINQFPLFLILGSLVLILFMYADCVPSNNEFYRKACGEFNNDINEKTGAADARACFFEEEYDATRGSFDLAANYYKDEELNLYVLREELKKNGKAKAHFSHDVKQRIYSMAIDRKKNLQLIAGIVLILLNFMVLVLDLMYFFDLNVSYFMLSSGMFSMITYATIGITLILNIVQICLVGKQERLIARMAFNSRFLEEKELEKRFTEHLVDGLIKPIDIVRGVYQYDAYLYSKESRESLAYKDKIQLHYVEIADKGRMAVTIWLFFCMAFSRLIWMERKYYLFPFLLIGTIAFHVLMDKYLLPFCSRNMMRWRVWRYKTARGNEKKKNA